MERNATRARRFGRLVTLAGLVAAIALVSVPAAGTSGIGNGLFAFVRATNGGPLPACPPDCTFASRVDHFVYVANLNRPTGEVGRMANRTTLPDAFVVQGVEQRIFINGVEYVAPFVFTPPPNPSYRPWSGHWPATVNCPPPPSGDPCNLVTSPAVVPGEVTSVLYAGWVHGDEEPDGRYVFKYTVRGTLEGMPVELRASSQPIKMTR